MTKDNLLYDLAQAMAMSNRHLAAAALRKLGQAGYTSLEEIDRASDWVLLAIPGIGVGRLGEVRRLTRPDWQPPSEQAVKAADDFLATVQFALRFWPVEALVGVIQGSAPAVPVGQPVDKRLALDLLSQATNRAVYHCSIEDLVEALRQTRNGHHDGRDRQAVGSSSAQAETPKNGQGNVPTGGADRPSRKRDAGRNNEHFAFLPDKRREIVQHYRAARESGQVVNKDSWADKNYGISGRTLLRYEREYEQAEVERK
jgi:hypothetical protein